MLLDYGIPFAGDPVRIPFTSLELVGHHVGEPVDRVPATEVASTDIAHAGLPFKIRSTRDEAVAARLRRQFAGRAERSYARIMEGEAVSPPIVQSVSMRDAKAVAAASEDALQKVQLALYNRHFGALKSDNKMWSGAVVPSFAPVCYSGIVNYGGSPADIAMQSVRIWLARTHNCGELAVAAQDVLAHRNPKLPTSLAMLGGAHHFAVIGHLDAETVSRPMATWPPHLQVCDPWANLNCRACDYPRRFTEKMTQWADDGKLIRRGMHWHPADDKSWLDIVNQPPQVLVRRRHHHGLFTSVLPPLTGQPQDRDTGG